MSVFLAIAILVATVALIFSPWTVNLFYFLSGDQDGERFGLSGARASAVRSHHRCDSNNPKRRAAYDKGFTRGSERGKHNRAVMSARAEEYANTHTV